METNAISPQENSETQDLSNLERKMRFTGTVIKTSLAGALVDIGYEIPGVVHISQIQEEPVNRVEDVIQQGQTVDVWVRRVIPKKKRLELTMIEPLNLEWREIKKDMVIKGTVTRIEKFGVFIEIGAERPGLVHISEMTHDYINSASDIVKVGDEVDVMVLSVNRYKKQIKLSMKALEVPPADIVFKGQKTSKSRADNKKEEIQEETPVPTAMEMAFQEAMERSKEQSDEVPELIEETPEPELKNDELEQILDRTLHNRVKTNK
jgi:ribosomal protein S1